MNIRLRIVILGCSVVTAAGTIWAQWVQTNGPYGGTIKALTASGLQIYAGTEGGVFRSTDGGISWAEGALSVTISALAASGGKLFAGTPGSGVDVSADSGTTWEDAKTGLTNLRVKCLAVSATKLFAGTEGGVFLSTNDGASWTGVSTGLTSLDISALAASGAITSPPLLRGSFPP